MATPMTYDQMLAALKAEGLTVKEVAGSRDRCRCHSGSHAKGGPTIRAWGPMNGIMVHITAGNLGGRTPEQYIASIINGDKALPDKVQLVTDPDGVVYLNSAGRSNHAGEISQSSLTHSIDADWPLDKWTDHRGEGVDGNAHFYGIENIAASSMTSAQRAATVKICAAIARHHGWTGQETVGHGECSDQRSYADPGLNTGALRKDVMAAVKKGSQKPVDPPAATDPTPEPTVKTVKITSATQNLAGAAANTYGVTTAKARLVRYIAARKATPVTSLLTQEVNTTMLKQLKAGLPMQYGGGGNGRYIFLEEGVKILGSGVFTAPAAYLDDTKQCAWVVYEKDGAISVEGSMHTEYRDGAKPDEIRVDQAAYFADQLLAKAKKYGAPLGNTMIAGDTNSTGMVLAALVKKGWRNVAAGTKFEDEYTFIDWSGKARDRVDYALVYDGDKTAPALAAKTVALSRRTDISDHAGLRFERLIRVTK